MAKDEAKLGQTAPIGARLVVDFVLGVFEETNRLLALVHEILHEQFEVLVVVQEADIVFVLFENDAKMLIGVWQYVEYERWTVLQVHTTVRAQVDHLVHQFPRLLDRTLVDGRLRAVLVGRGLRYSIGEAFKPLSSHLAC